MDQQILFLINRTGASPALDRVMAAASSFSLWLPFLAVAVVIAAVFGSFRMRAMLLTAALALGISDGIVVNSLKHLVGRPRPYQVMEGVRTLDLEIVSPRVLALWMPLRIDITGTTIRPFSGNSFPSGHASNNFTFAAVCTAFYRRWGWISFITAALVSYSRIYTGSHWPVDVVFSCLIGLGVGLLTVAAVESVWRKWIGPRFARAYEKHPSLIVS